MSRRDSLAAAARGVVGGCRLLSFLVLFGVYDLAAVLSGRETHRSVTVYAVDGEHEVDSSWKP